MQPEKTLSEFTLIHDQCLAAWDAALQTGETEQLKTFPDESYQGIFGYAGGTPVEPVDRSTAVDGLTQLNNALRGAQHSAQDRVIRLRGDAEAVVSYERIFNRDDHILASFFVLQTWQKKDGSWRVIREMAEHINASV